MEIIKFKIGGVNPIKVGLPNKGTIQCMLTFKYSESGEIEETEIHVNGYDTDSKLDWISAKSKDFHTINISKGENEELILPERALKQKAEMSEETQIKIYNNLKRELEKKGLI